ncbi:ribonuclease H-like domain-containing protein [Artemisia annua]|uniref:Ribonuclease H-like domain-containing protein n=1 Tax=Artemisia annua TaxID=35608 RepID=A0A2U1MU59_ARTAN|nr:ribonuclease H-like domain-containing protein [Artemisia annua]
MADFLAEVDTPIPGKKSKAQPIPTGHDDEIGFLYTDGASCKQGSGGRVSAHKPIRARLHVCPEVNFDSSKNESEHEALLVGLRIAKTMKVFTDSLFVASQVMGEYIAKKGRNSMGDTGSRIRLYKTAVLFVSAFFHSHGFLYHLKINTFEVAAFQKKNSFKVACQVLASGTFMEKTDD